MDDHDRPVLTTQALKLNAWLAAFRWHRSFILQFESRSVDYFFFSWELNRSWTNFTHPKFDANKTKTAFFWSLPVSSIFQMTKCSLTIKYESELSWKPISIFRRMKNFCQFKTCKLKWIETKVRHVIPTENFRECNLPPSSLFWVSFAITSQFTQILLFTIFEFSDFYFCCFNGCPLSSVAKKTGRNSSQAWQIFRTDFKNILNIFKNSER